MTSQPNIVFILADDMGAWAMGCAGNREVKTPNLDRLAQTGMRFEQFFCTSPVCSPARATIMTGRIPSQHGVHDWIRGGNVGQEQVPEKLREHRAFKHEVEASDYLEGQLAYTDLLADAGYKLAMSGKWHLGNNIVPRRGFQHWFTIAGGGGPYMEPIVADNGQLRVEKRYITELITERAIQYMDELVAEESPFYLSVHYTAPHSPWDRGQHPQRYVDLYDDCPFESVPDIPEHPSQSPTAPRPQGNPERRRELLQGYYGAITAMDEGIGRIVDRLEALGVRENTLVVFMGDNGMNMGHHGIWGKGNGTFPLNMYDTSVKVPAIMNHPGVIPAGEVRGELISQYDVFPTLLEYARIENPAADQLPGRSFAHLLTGASMAEPSRQDVVVYDEYGPVRMIRTDAWKYVHRYPYGPHELYHVASDPEEQHNRVDEPECSTTVGELRARLGEWFRSYVNPEYDGIYAPVSGFGQMRPMSPGATEHEVFRKR